MSDKKFLSTEWVEQHGLLDIMSRQKQFVGHKSVGHSAEQIEPNKVVCRIQCSL